MSREHQPVDPAPAAEPGQPVEDWLSGHLQEDGEDVAANADSTVRTDGRAEQAEALDKES